MKAFAAVLRLDGRAVHDAEVERMARACDLGTATTTWTSGAAGLVAGVSAAPGRLDLAISADCRLDNREELADALEIERSRLPETSDDALILAAWERWGTSCCDRLLGDFSFAIVDAHTRRLFCARDPIGAKPLYVFRSPDVLAVASRVSPIRMLPDVTLTLNERRVADVFVSALEGFDHESTFFREIERLAPAHWLLVENGNVTRRRYWTPPEPVEAFQDEETADEALRHVLSAAVRCRLDRDGSSAIMLSGGLDSSAIVSLACAARGAAVRTCSVVSDEPDCVESARIRTVAGARGVESRLFVASDVSAMGSDLESVVLVGEEPFDAFMALPQLVYAKETGTSSSIVDGVDGDLAVSLLGSPIPHLIRTGRWASALRQTFSESEGRALTAVRRFAGSLLTTARLRRPFTSTDELASIAVDEGFARRHAVRERTRIVSERLRFDPRLPVAHEQWRVLTDPFVASGLERYARVAGRFGIEPRHPFFDRRVLEFCASLPWSLKLRGRHRKYLLRRAFAQALPREIVWSEERRHLGIDVYRALLARFDEQIRDALSMTGAIGEVVDLERVHQSYRKICTKFGSIEDCTVVWRAAVCSIWLNRIATQGRFSAQT
ncbi:MAG: hypothetical protein HYU52_17850 [Acidobacteria bacterium]|nr:hypothetical protein [Acidobacteriota bacterium]